MMIQNVFNFEHKKMIHKKINKKKKKKRLLNVKKKKRITRDYFLG